MKIKAWVYPNDIFLYVPYQYKEPGTVPCVITIDKKHMEGKLWPKTRSKTITKKP